jgi:hypothetical protein
MRYLVAVALLVGPSLTPVLRGVEPAETRYGVSVDPKTYPQSTAKETLASVIKAVEDKRIDYLVAQLANPEYIDDRVQRLYDGKFEPQVEDTRLKMDAGTQKLFQRFLKEGEWTSDKSKDQCVRLKDIKDRCIYFRRIGERWYLENRYKPAD